MRTPDPAAAAPSAACTPALDAGDGVGGEPHGHRALTPREPLADAADHRLRRRLRHAELLAQDLPGEVEEQPRPLSLHLGRQLDARREEPRRRVLERAPPGLEAGRPLGMGLGAPLAPARLEPAARAPSPIASISARSCEAGRLPRTRGHRCGRRDLAARARRRSSGTRGAAPRRRTEAPG